MIVSLNPRTGVIEPYSEDIQADLRSKSVPSSTFLGSKCFQATVHLVPSGEHYQTTPLQVSRGQCVKHPGYRQVRNITTALVWQSYKVLTPNGWRFCCANHPEAQRIVFDLPNNRVHVWQWCSETTLSMDDRDWRCYESAVNQSLESIWDRLSGGVDDAFDLVIPVGITTKRISVDRSHVFFQQQDLRTGNTRWVRRVQMELLDLQNIRTMALQTCPTDTCSICITEFTETPLLPRHQLRCGHWFHSACLAPLHDDRCPLCRTPF